MNDPMLSPPALVTDQYVFGVHRLRPLERELLRRSERVEIGGRAFDLLQLLVQRPGQVVSKHDIFAAVWPTTLVDESNLRFQVAVLRRALGPDADAVKTIAGRGYVFAARVELRRGAVDLSCPPPEDGDGQIGCIPGIPVASHPDPNAQDVSSLRAENVVLRQALADLLVERLNQPQGRRPWTDFVQATNAAA